MPQEDPAQQQPDAQDDAQAPAMQAPEDQMDGREQTQQGMAHDDEQYRTLAGKNFAI